MGFGGIGVAQLLIILFIVVLIFGTKRLKQAGGDVGGMIRGVKEGIRDAEPVADELAELDEDLKRIRHKVR